MNAAEIIQTVKDGAAIAAGEMIPANKKQHRRCVTAYFAAEDAANGRVATLKSAEMELRMLRDAVDSALERITMRIDDGGELTVG